MTATELLSSLMPRLAHLPDTSGLNFLESLNRAVDMVFGRMWRQRSDMGKKVFGSLVIDSSVPVALPPDFRALVCTFLFVEGADAAGYTVNPLPPGDIIDYEVNRPEYYYITGDNEIGLSPSPDQAYTIKGWYYAAPVSIAMADSLPWNGIFDIIIGDIVLMLAAGQVSEPAVNGMVDKILFQRQTTPKRNKLW